MGHRLNPGSCHLSSFGRETLGRQNFERKSVLLEIGPQAAADAASKSPGLDLASKGLTQRQTGSGDTAGGGLTSKERQHIWRVDFWQESC